ncbi:type VII secretion-associated serine protease mycosin [Streptomyces albireticuli]|uniref:Type VII secretion-associated serine protease mycosin n=1 Tax=Streptomyces albireticuli TaxID=1940 RepID=A0A2A2D3C3_9ACTN|nr:type VII secretion-associated serine protease mycosin [Streptomyces albireticuli]MCD9144000.1 type VII secretion-associated serine protease mycosin [Streptomyces albireticuli]MCD9162357.1 type VII secretion-associated serine protease mycosin [Streptomyces albireticuli]MCD9195474.1 type VII secretion-associated serine protease mycosin [Streptomyces albireticuli]PAU45830.1 type VII secretion-associated serine protease mycosin [Streptomyces albireticuli]
MPRTTTSSAAALTAALLTALSSAPAMAAAASVGPVASVAPVASAGPSGVPVALDGSGECTSYPAKTIKGTPWSLQRVLLDRLWQDTKGRDSQGNPVRIAVIDTGVDVRNPQLKDAVDAKSGVDLLAGMKEAPQEGAASVRAATKDGPQDDPTSPAKKTPEKKPSGSPSPKASEKSKEEERKREEERKKEEERRKEKEREKEKEKEKERQKEKEKEKQVPEVKTDPTLDLVGHGTKVAGIIAARPSSGSGFVGIAPESVIIPIRQNDEKGTGTSRTLAQGITHAVAAGARVINISQDTSKPLLPDSDLELAVKDALAKDVVVVASAGNDGLDGNVKETYPAAYKGVLAVAASDRNNERAVFSQPGEFIGVAAPGVEMVSTVPLGGQCVDNGTSFSAPYVAGVAALIRAKHPDWKQHQVVAQIEQTAERAVNGHDRYVGWGVVDPVRALTEDAHPIDKVTPDKAAARNVRAPEAAALPLGETPQQRQERLATYVLGGAGVLVAVIAGTAVVLRDHRRRASRSG